MFRWGQPTPIVPFVENLPGTLVQFKTKGFNFALCYLQTCWSIICGKVSTRKIAICIGHSTIARMDQLHPSLSVIHNHIPPRWGMFVSWAMVCEELNAFDVKSVRTHCKKGQFWAYLEEQLLLWSTVLGYNQGGSFGSCEWFSSRLPEPVPSLPPLAFSHQSPSYPWRQVHYALEAHSQSPSTSAKYSYPRSGGWTLPSNGIDKHQGPASQSIRLWI